MTAQADITAGFESSYIAIRNDRLDIASGGSLNLRAGSNVNMQSGSDFNVAAGGNVNIEAGATLNIRAASLNITSTQGAVQSFENAVSEIAQNAADGKTTVYYQADAPDSAQVGDLWYETDVTPVVIKRYDALSSTPWQTLGVTAATTGNTSTKAIRTWFDGNFTAGDYDMQIVLNRSAANTGNGEDTSVALVLRTASSGSDSAGGALYTATVADIIGRSTFSGTFSLQTEIQYMYLYLRPFETGLSATVRIRRSSSGTITYAWQDVTSAMLSSALTNAAVAQQTADGKATCYTQETPPESADTGDFWIDTSDDNKLYTWSGSQWAVAVSGAVKTTGVLIDGANLELLAGGKMDVKSGADMTIAAGGDFLLKGGDTPGEYLGISSTEPISIYSGAENASGAAPKFSVSKYGELSANDANISGTVAVSGEMSFGEAVSVTFLDTTARYNFLRAMAAGDALPYSMGGTGAISRENAMKNLSLMVGSGAVSGVTAAGVGDRYLLLMPNTSTPANTMALARSGYTRQKVSSQRRRKTQKIYDYSAQSGDTDYLPSDTTSYSSWYDTGTPSYLAVTTSGTPYCYESTGSASGRYSGSVTTTSTTQSRPSTEDPTGTFYYIETIKTNYEYRTYTRDVYWTTLPAPTAGTSGNSIKNTAVKTAILTLTTNASASAEYTLYLSTTQDGQSGKTVIGISTGAASLVFSLSDVIPTIYTSQRYLVLERAGESSAPVTVTAASLALSYYSGAKRTEEYIWNGAAWVLLCVSPDEYLFHDTTDMVIPAGSALFTYTLATPGQEGDRYDFEFIGYCTSSSNFFLYVNGNATNGDYVNQYVYNGTTYSIAPLIAFTSGASYACFARGTISVLGGRIFITGIGQRGGAACSTSHFSISYAASTLTSIQVKNSGAAGANCRFRVKRS